MNKQKLIPVLAVLLFTACANSDNNTDQSQVMETTTAQVDSPGTANDAAGSAETMPITIAVNENASLEEQIADALYFLASTEGNELYNGYYSSINLMDVNFDDIPEIVLYNSAGSAADFVYFYDISGMKIGSFGIPSMNVEYNCVENNGKELFMISAKSLNYHPQNGEEGPTEYHFISVMDFDNGEEHNYSSTIIYENDTLENILSATVRTDDVEIEGIASADEIEMYYDSFMADYDVVGSVESIRLDISDTELSSREAILERITEEVRKFEIMG